MLFVVAIGSVLVNQVTDFVDEAPRYIEDAETWINDTFDADVNADDLVEQFQEGGTGPGVRGQPRRQHRQRRGDGRSPCSSSS